MRFECVGSHVQWPRFLGLHVFARLPRLYHVIRFRWSIHILIRTSTRAQPRNNKRNGRRYTNFKPKSILGAVQLASD